MPTESSTVTPDELFREFRRVLDKQGFTEHRAELLARIFTENTRDGVLSHGINRFPAFIDFVRRGLVKLHAEPTLLNASGAFERWDGNQGPGPLNAHFCMNRATELARVHSIGTVALRNTNHWMRGGTYGLQAADNGCIGICWTNTTALMPPWGSMEPRVGNNPLVLCVPNTPNHLLLDMSMSQFSFGRMAIAARSSEQLPVPGGFDQNGNLTRNADEIMRSKRPLPIGYWKGSGLALLLDCIASLLAAGSATFEISQRTDETNVCQLFIAIDIANTSVDTHTLRPILDDFRSAQPLDPGSPVTFPGERTSERRRASSANGIAIDTELWESIKKM